jgi:hypothetical protein
VSASSKTLSPKERAFLQDELRRAKAARDSGAAYSERQLHELNDAASAQSRVDHNERAAARRDAEAVHLESGTPGVKASILQQREIEAERRRRIVTNCDASGCWDAAGTRYIGAGGGFLFTRTSDGRQCRKIGPRMECD